MPSENLSQPGAGDLLASVFHATGRIPVRITFRQLVRAGIVAEDSHVTRGIPCCVLTRARENGCVVWGPYLPSYIIERVK